MSGTEYCDFCEAEGFIKARFNTKVVLDCGHVVDVGGASVSKRETFVPRALPRATSPRREAPVEEAPRQPVPSFDAPSVARTVGELLFGRKP